MKKTFILFFILFSCSKSDINFSVSCNKFLGDIKVQSIFLDIDFNQNKVFETALPTADGIRYEDFMEKNMANYARMYGERSLEYNILESSPAYVKFSRKSSSSPLGISITEINHNIDRTTLDYTISAYTYNSDGSLLDYGDIDYLSNPIIVTYPCKRPEV